MTLQQLQYVIYIANSGSLSKAATLAYISQPSLSQSLKELENEIGFEIFTRNNRGITITSKGEEFLSYARQVIEQYQLIEDKFINKPVSKKKFSVSCQHYSFAVDAFIKTVKQFGLESYEVSIKETKTYTVIYDVTHMKSEIGIIYLNHFNKAILTKLFSDNKLSFTPLFTCDIYAYMSKDNPLANNPKVTLEQLQKYPCLSFEQGLHNSFYFSEEVLPTLEYNQMIKASDRATMLNLMKGLHGYTLCSGIISEDLNGSDYKAVEVDSDEVMEIGYIHKVDVPLSDIAKKYIHEVNNIYASAIGNTYN